MTNVHVDRAIADVDRRRLVYDGDIFVYSPTSSSRALCVLADTFTREAFAPLDPETAQHELPVRRYAEILADLKPRFIHHPDCKRLIPEILSDLGCDTEQTYFDVPRLRTSTSDNYLTTGIAYAFHPHRDTWYSAAPCQINWWMAVREISAGNCMAFYPRYFNQPVKNSSSGYNYYVWNALSRSTAAQHVGSDTRKQPVIEEPIDLDPDLRLVPPVGSLIVFSAAQLHASVVNTTGRTRISIDFRTVNSGDVHDRQGARNVDSESTGTSLRDFLRCSDLARLPEDLAALYDEEEIPPDGIKIYRPS